MSPSSLSRAWIKSARTRVPTGLQHRLQVTYQLLLVLAASYSVYCLSGRTEQKVERPRTMWWVALTHKACLSMVDQRMFLAKFYVEKKSPSSRTGNTCYLVCSTLCTSNVGVSTLSYESQINIWHSTWTAWSPSWPHSAWCVSNTQVPVLVFLFRQLVQLSRSSSVGVSGVHGSLIRKHLLRFSFYPMTMMTKIQLGHIMTAERCMTRKKMAVVKTINLLVVQLQRFSAPSASGLGSWGRALWTLRRLSPQTSKGKHYERDDNNEYQWRDDLN